MAEAPTLDYARGALLEVEWLDSNQTSGWISEAEGEAYVKAAAATHRSCGYFFAATEQVIALVQSRVRYDETSKPMVTDVISIPLVAVLSVTPLLRPAVAPASEAGSPAPLLGNIASAHEPVDSEGQ